MALDSNIRGSVSGLGAEVNASNQLKVVLENNAATNPTNVGGIRVFSENDPGVSRADSPGVPYLRPPETSSDYRLRVGTDTVLFTDTFNSTVHNTNLWSYSSTTLTATQPGNGVIQFGTVQGTAATHGANIRSFQHFPLIGSAPISIEFTMGLGGTTLAGNEAWAMGVGSPAAAGTLPTDGVWIQISSAGVIGVISYNGVATQTGVMATLASVVVGSLDKWTIVIGEQEIEYWKDDVLLFEQTIPVTNGQPFQQVSVPVFAQKYCSGAVSNTNTIRLSDITVALMDINTSKPWAHQMASMGQGCYHFQNGSNPTTVAPHTQAIGTITTGSSPLLITGTAGSNTAANVTGLGGNGSITAPVAAVTDLIATSFLNPASTVNVVGRNLIITGIAISAINLGAAVAVTPTTLMWSIGYGHTSVSMATTETANTFVSGTTHAPRRIQLGFMSTAIAAVIGATYDKEIVRQFTSPIVVRPGEFINTFFKVVVGTATTSQVIGYNVMFDGYWE